MIFENDPVLPDSLPRMQDLHFQSLEPAFRKVMYWSNGLFFLLILLVVLVFLVTGPGLKPGFWLYAMLGGWLLAMLITLAFINPRFRSMGYVLRQRDIVFRRGVLMHIQTVIPFNRVQHCEIRQGPIEKYMDLATIKIYTAGGHSSDLSIQGIRSERASKLKEFIINQVSQDEQADA